MKTSELIHRLVANTEPVQPLPSPPRRLSSWALASMLSVGVVVWFLGLSEKVALMLSNNGFLMETSLILVTAIMSAGSAFILSIPGSGPKRSLFWLPVLTLVTWGALLGVGFSHSQPQTSFSQFIRFGYPCSLDMLAIGIIPGILLFWMIRRAAPVRLALTGSLGSLAVISVAAFGVQFTCSHGTHAHLLAWHFLPVLVLTGGGLFLGQKLFRW